MALQPRNPKMSENDELFDDFHLELEDKDLPLDADVFCDKVNLPIYINPDELKKRPCFNKLLVDLSERITERGLLKERQDIQEEARAKVRQRRKPWLRQSVFHQCVRELIHEWQADKKHRTSYHHLYRDAFHTAELCASLAQPDDGNVLGLSRDDVIEQTANPAKLEKYKNQFVTDLEEFIKRKCERVTRFHDNKDQGSKVLSARASMLPMVVENERVKYEEEKRNLILERRNVDKQLAAYHKSLERVSVVFEELLTRLKLTVLAEKDRVDCDWLLARAEALMLKSRIIDLQLRCELYNKNTVGALNSVSSHLDEELHSREDELKQVELMLEAYESVGPGYDDLVTEFSKLRDTLDDKLWAKRELAGNLRPS